MKKVLLFCLFLFAQLYLLSQSPIDNSFNIIENVNCAYDDNVILNQVENIEIFQTIDGSIYSEIDSTICIDITADKKIYLNQIDLSRPLFIREKDDYASAPELDSNSVYFSNFVFLVSDALPLELGENCEDGFCSGLSYNISSVNNTVQRKSIHLMPGGGGFLCDIQTCFTSEKMNDQKITESLLKFTFNDTLPNDSTFIELVQHNMYKEYSNLQGGVDELMYAYENNGTTTYYSQFHFYPILLHQTDGIPSESNIHYYDLPVITPSDTQQIIEVYLDEYSTFFVQPFVQIRGALVDSLEEERHIIHWHDSIFNSCMNAIIDRVFANGDQYFFHGGNIHFSSTMSCMQFKQNSAMNIVNNADMWYGNDGNGILMLRGGSTINIGKNASLTIDGKLWMLDRKEATEPEQIYMELNSGSHLKFTKNAIISNLYSLDGNMKLNIYMNGGTIDLKELKPEFRKYINLIYPTEELIEKSIRIYPNPNYSNELNISFESGSENNSANIQIHDITGRKLYQKNVSVRSGNNELIIPTSFLKNGFHIISIHNNGKIYSQKFIKG